MLEIVQAHDFKKYQEIIKTLDIADEIISIVEALDKNEVIGFGIYHYNSDKVIIDFVESYEDKYLYDGIVRSILFLAITNNINCAEFKVVKNQVLIELGFVNENDNYIQNISDFMDKCKNCKKS